MDVLDAMDETVHTQSIMADCELHERQTLADDQAIQEVELHQVGVWHTPTLLVFLLQSERMPERRCLYIFMNRSTYPPNQYQTAVPMATADELRLRALIVCDGLPCGCLRNRLRASLKDPGG